MAAPVKAAIAPDLDLGTGYVLQFTALNPVNGAAVTGVTVSGANLTVANVLGGDLSQLFTDDVPLWLDLPNTLPEPNGG